MRANMLDLCKVPSFSYPFLWADYVELLCLCSENGVVSKGNIDAATQEAQDIQVSDWQDDEGWSDDQADAAQSEELDDQVSRRWSDISHQLVTRRTQYGQHWPFELDGQILRKRFDNDQPAHRLYAALLIASSLRLVSRSERNDVSAAFEGISFHWLRHSLGPCWEVRSFGARTRLPQAYTGKMWDKITQLAADIQATPAKRKCDYDPRDTGDGQIDLVAWLSMGDKRGNIPVIFAQCACSPTDWEEKQLEASPAASSAHLNLQHPGATYCFVPHELYKGEQHWARASHVKSVVLIDRLRLFRLFEHTQAFANLDSASWRFVDTALQSKAPMPA